MPCFAQSRIPSGKSPDPSSIKISRLHARICAASAAESELLPLSSVEVSLTVGTPWHFGPGASGSWFSRKIQVSNFFHQGSAIDCGWEELAWDIPLSTMTASCAYSAPSRDRTSSWIQQGEG